MHKKSLFLSLSGVTIAFANNPNANWLAAMEKAEMDQAIKISPLIILAIGIALFFSLIQRYPKQAVLGCGGLSALAFVIGIFTWFLDFVARHAFVFILLGVLVAFICLIAYMIYTPPSPPKINEEDKDQTNDNNPLL